MLMKNVVRAESANHSKEAKHPKVEDGCCWQANSKEEHNRVWCTRKKALKALMGQLVMVMNSSQFCII